MVHFCSTRGGVRGLSFEQAVLTGLASDRGLLVPEVGEFPTLPANALDLWQSLSYQSLAVKVMSLFIDESEVSCSELHALVNKSYNPTTFRAPDVAPIVKITDQLLVLELFHGPTFAFKDIALQFLGNLFDFFLQRRNKTLAAGAPKHKITVVGATSGDTGSSAIYGLRGKPNIEVFILFPEGRVSAIQQRQMTTVLDTNIHNVTVKGTFDDCQAIVKDLFADAEFKAAYRLGAVNSINFARILAQIVYYVWAYFRAREQGVTGDVAFSVPTGNFGDILAGFYAKKLGVPIGKLIVATNENDILHRFFSTGKYDRRDIEHTISPSMDICVSSNFERYLFALAGEDHDVLRGWMQAFEQTGELTITGELLAKAQDEMASYAVLQEEVRSTIAEYNKAQHYLFDPHSAIGAAAATRFGSDAGANRPDSAVVVVGTAHYGKFLPVVSEALGVAESEIQQHPILKALESLPTRVSAANNSTADVAKHICKTLDEKN
uniref:Threonine synthase n=1 Tax=Hyaloperonospora arabidopsidis (strain Emoy2) TaxID=559515 RepID=M4BM75_HYAAE